MAFVIACWSAALIGLVNGWFVTRLKIPSFLVTLGMLLVVRGTALFVTDGFPQRTWNAGDTGSPRCWSAISTSARSASTCRCSGSSLAAVILGYILTQTKFGNWIQASGGNPNAARARGVNVERHQGRAVHAVAR